MKRTLPTWKKLLYALLFGAAVLLLLECALWIAGVQTLIEREDPLRGFSGLVKVFQRDGQVYRTRSSGQHKDFNDQSFATVKPADGLRIFCLGGSSAYGYPWDAQAAFSGVLGDVLAAASPRRSVEVVNAAGISYGMHRLNLVADEILGYEPDVLVVYSGHNEFVEPSFFEALKRRSAIRNHVTHALAHVRVYSALQGLWHRPVQRKAADVDGIGRYVLREDSVVYDRAQKHEIVEAFAAGLRRLVRTANERGVRVVTATVPCNLRQWRPTNSLLLSGTSAAQRRDHDALAAAAGLHLESREFSEAVGVLRRALKIAPDHAGTHYLIGQAYEGVGEWDKARAAYRRACDLDGSPVRRITGINDAIRAVAREEGVLLVDVEEAFEARSEHGLVGFNLIEDYVHPTVEGHQLIAWLVWDAMARAGWLGEARQAPRQLFEKVVAGRAAQKVAAKEFWLHNQAVILENQGQRGLAIQKYREALSIAPGHIPSLVNLAAILAEDGKDSEALRLLQRLVTIAPKEVGGRILYGDVLARGGKLPEAIAQYRRAVDQAPYNVLAWNQLGLALLQGGDLEGAVSSLQRVLRDRPRDAELHANLGVVFFRQKKWKESADSLQKAIAINPDSFRSRLNLGVLHFHRRRFKEAAAQFEEALRIKPNDSAASEYLKRVGTLSENP